MEESNPTMSGGRINQPTTTDADIRRQSPTMNYQYASTTYDNRKSAYSLAVDSLAIISKMADNINDQIIIGNKNYLPQKQRPQNSTIVSVDRVDGLPIPSG